jgi:hypothetical protein
LAQENHDVCTGVAYKKQIVNMTGGLK